MPAPSKRASARSKSRPGDKPEKKPSSGSVAAGSKRTGVKQGSDATALKAKAASVVTSSKPRARSTPRTDSPGWQRRSDKKIKTPPAPSGHDVTVEKAKKVVEAANASSERSLMAEADAEATQVGALIADMSTSTSSAKSAECALRTPGELASNGKRPAASEWIRRDPLFGKRQKHDDEPLERWNDMHTCRMCQRKQQLILRNTEIFETMAAQAYKSAMSAKQTVEATTASDAIKHLHECAQHASACASMAAASATNAASALLIYEEFKSGICRCKLPAGSSEDES